MFISFVYYPILLSIGIIFICLNDHKLSRWLMEKKPETWSKIKYQRFAFNFIFELLTDILIPINLIVTLNSI